MKRSIYTVAITIAMLAMFQQAFASEQVWRGKPTKWRPGHAQILMTGEDGTVYVGGGLLIDLPQEMKPVTMSKKSKWVLTAAHVVLDEKPLPEGTLIITRTTARVWLGDERTDILTGLEQRVEVERIYLFGYSGFCCGSDIALLKLVAPAQETYSGTQPVVLPETLDVVSPKTGMTITIRGHGDQGVTPRDPILQEGDMRITDESRIKEKHFCATPAPAAQGHGDSGTVSVDESGKMVGVVSYGPGCQERIDVYLDQIIEIMLAESDVVSQPYALMLPIALNE